MGAWESQVLGYSIFGLYYCELHPIGSPIIGRTAGLTSYKQCAKLSLPISRRSLRRPGGKKIACLVA